jgi:hypothetical protein
METTGTKGTRHRWAWLWQRLPLVTLLCLLAHLATLLVPYVLHNNLQKGDGAGHLALVTLTRDHLLPWGSGWLDQVWGGFPAGQLYPPLFHLVGAWLALAVSPATAVKILVTLTWLTIPLALSKVTAQFIGPGTPREDRPGLHATLLLAGWCAVILPSQILGITETLGSNPESAIGNGMFPSAAGLAAFLLFLQTLLKHGIRAPGRLAGTLAATVLLHPVWALVAALCASVFAARSLVVGHPTRPRLALLAAWLSAALLAFGLSAWFALPFLLHSGQLHSTYIPLHWPVTMWTALLVTAGLTVIHWRRLPPRIKRLATAAGTLCLLAGAGNLKGLSFHFYRLTIPVAVLALPLLAYLLYQPWQIASQGRPTRLFRAANLLLVAVMAVLFSAAGPVYPAGNPDLALPDLTRYDPGQGRIAATADPLHSPGYMALPWAVIAAGGSVSHGISVESARTGRAIFGLLRRLNPAQYVWGISMAGNPALRRPDKDGSALLEQLQILGFSHILTDRKLLPSLTTRPAPGPPVLTFPNVLSQSPKSRPHLEAQFTLDLSGANFLYHLYPLPSPTLVDTNRTFQGVPAPRFDEYTESWFALAGEAPVPVKDSPDRYVADMSCRTQVDHRSPSGSRLVLSVEGCTGTTSPLYVKVPYHPYWQARDSGGQPVPLMAAGYGMMVLAGNGLLTLEYVPGTATWLGRGLTLLALLAGLLLLGRKRTSEKNL